MFLEQEVIRDKDNATRLKEGGGIEMSTTVFYNRGDRDKANETDLKEGGGIEMSNYSALPYTHHSLLLVLNIYLPTADVVNCVSGKQSNKNAVL